MFNAKFIKAHEVIPQSHNSSHMTEFFFIERVYGEEIFVQNAS